MGKRITQEEIIEIEAMCKEGANLMQIAEKVGRCQSAVKRILEGRGYKTGIPVAKNKETYKIPLRPEEIRRFRNDLNLGSMVYMEEDGSVKKFSVIEKYTYIVRLETVGSRRPHKTSASYVDLMLAGGKTNEFVF